MPGDGEILNNKKPKPEITLENVKKFYKIIFVKLK